MKTLNNIELSNINGGDFIDGACAGVGAAASVYGLGIIANLWNPPGMIAGITMGVVGLGCAAYTMA